VKDTLLP
jgi:hypothetical protein